MAFRSLALAIALASPWAAAAPAHWAFLLDDQPSAATFTPTSRTSNSGGGTNSVTRTSAGVYEVMLPTVGARAGVVHVTAYGSDNHACKVVGWGPIGADQLVNVRCFDAAGTLADTAFTITFANPITPDGRMAYLWADQPSAAAYTPSLTYQFNSTGGTNTMQRTATGVYVATLPGVGPGFGGHVQVTAYGPGSERCKVAQWLPSGNDKQVHVKCFTVGGAAVDTRFTLTYVQSASVIGGGVTYGSGTGPSGAYAWADQPHTGSYTPDPAYQWYVIGTGATVFRFSTGNYSVYFNNTTNNWDDVQVTAYGDGAVHCKVASWNSIVGVNVACFDNAGERTDSRFDVALMSFIVGGI